MRLHSKELGLSGRLGVPKLGIVGGPLVLLMLVAAACDDKAQPTGPTATQESPGTGAQTQQVATPTATPTPQLLGSTTPTPASETYRQDLGPGVVVAFVEGLSPEMPDKVAYVTHVPSGSQAVLDRDGRVIERHNGRGDGPSRLDAVLQDRAAMNRIMEGLKSDEHMRPREAVDIYWPHMIQFGGIHYLARWRLPGEATREADRDLTVEDLGPELYRIAFKSDGYVGIGYRYQDGDATYMNPGTPVYAVKGYAPEFRLAILEEDRVTLFDADTNPLAKTGEDLLDIRGKVAAVDVLSEEDARTVFGTIDEESQVKRFIEMVLQSPVDQTHRDHEGPRYFLGFRLADGTSVVRSFWLESGELSRGIMTDPFVASMVASVLPVEPAVLEALKNIAKDPMARIAERVPGFGGAFRDPDQNIVYIYLQDASMQEEAERALNEEFGPDFLSGREVRVLKGEYSMDHLNAWYRTVSGVVWHIPGLAWTDLDERKNRIEIGMYPMRGGREEMEAAIATVNVPRGAIVIEVGCEGKWPRDLGEPPDEAFLRAVDYSLDVVSQAPYGETVQMKLTLRNVSDGTVSFVLGGRPPYDFEVSTPDGEQVWHWKCGTIIEEPLDGKTLEPGEELEFVGEWEQVDNRGEPVPPGTYLVRAVLNLDPPEELVTEARELEVQMPTTADTPSPTATPTPAPMPTRERDRHEEPPQGPGVEIGTGYPYTLYVHCGVRDARFDGRLWMADPMLSDGSGNPPLDWAPADSVGIMELVNDNLAVFTTESGRTIQFKPWPLDVEWRPCA